MSANIHTEFETARLAPKTFKHRPHPRDWPLTANEQPADEVGNTPAISKGFKEVNMTVKWHRFIS